MDEPTLPGIDTPNFISELFIQLTPARKKGRILYVRAAAVIVVEQDPDPSSPAFARHREIRHDNNQCTLVRLAGSDYTHFVDESPDEVIRRIEAQRR